LGKSIANKLLFSRTHLNGKMLGMVAHICHPGYKRKHRIGGSRFSASLGKK
jgi:hypothetical protein